MMKWVVPPTPTLPALSLTLPVVVRLEPIASRNGLRRPQLAPWRSVVSERLRSYLAQIPKIIGLRQAVCLARRRMSARAPPASRPIWPGLTNEDATVKVRPPAAAAQEPPAADGQRNCRLRWRGAWTIRHHRTRIPFRSDTQSPFGDLPPLERLHSVAGAFGVPGGRRRLPTGLALDREMTAPHRYRFAAR